MTDFFIIEYDNNNFVEESENMKLLEILKTRIEKGCHDYDYHEIIFSRKNDLSKMFNFKNLNDKITLSNDDRTFIFFTTAEPFIDWLILMECSKYLKYYNEVTFEGFIPGTYPKRAVSGSYVRRKLGNSATIQQLRNLPYSNNSFKIKSDIFEKWNVGLRVGRLQRGQVIRRILKKEPDIPTFKIDDILSTLRKKEIHSTILSYGKNRPLKRIEECGFCRSRNIRPIKTLHAQPIIGFLPMNDGWYWECQNCGLIFLNPRVKDEFIEELYDEEYFELKSDKPTITFSDNWIPAIDYGKKLRKGSLLDIGGGSGNFCKYFSDEVQSFEILMIDISKTAVDNAKLKGINAEQRNFLEMDFKEKFDIITLWEVVEHITLSDFAKYLNKVYSILNDGGVFIFSTPDFESFISRVFDFYVSFIPHHLYCFTRAWLRKFILRESKFKDMKFLSKDIVIKDRTDWIQYWKDFSNDMHLRNLADYFLEMKNKKTELYNKLIEYISEDSGSHIVGILRK
jgi:2-polyprenyl-3-methyl-5-hydroxy-6-metoxy-1,4-benzoquinol methylase